MVSLNFIMFAVILTVFNVHNCEGYRSYAQARKLYQNYNYNSNPTVSSRSSRQTETTFPCKGCRTPTVKLSNYQSVAFKSVYNNSLCLTRDISNHNQGLQIVVEPCIQSGGSGPFRRRTPWKLEVAQIMGAPNYFQISQGYRSETKPHGVAGCIAPDKNGIYASKESCSINTSYWNIKKVSGNHYLLVHLSTASCLSLPNNGIGVTTVRPCNPKDRKQFWEVDLKTQ